MTSVVHPGEAIGQALDARARQADDRGMGNIIRSAALTAGLLALAASAKHKPFTPGEAVAPPDAIAKAARVLSDRGYTVENRDDEHGQVTTAWEESNSMGTDRRLRWNVTVSNGIVRVMSQCQFRLEDPGPFAEKKWEDCGDSQPSERSDEAGAIASEIGR